jgi:hypothetical protein
MRYWGIFFGVIFAVTASATPGSIDRRFKPKLPAGARITTVFEQRDGRLLVAGTSASSSGNKALQTPFLVRLRANGQLDRSFRPLRDGLTIFGIDEIAERVDGIGLIGTFQTHGDGRRRNAVVLERNGKLVPYAPAANFARGTWLPDGGIAFDGFAHDVTYGRIGFLDASGAGPTYMETPYQQAQFAWLRAAGDGDVIGFLFRPAPVPPGEPRQLIYSTRHGGHEWRADQTPTPAFGPSNTLYLATDSLQLWRGAGLFHYQLPDAIFDRLPRTIPCLAPQSDGSIVYSVRYTVHGTNFIFRCAPDGSNDETFPTLLPNGPVNGLLALRTGGIIAWGDFTALNGAPVNNLIRLRAE